MASNVVRWGCIGTGKIALAMSEQLSMIPNAILMVICSASGRKLNVSKLYGFEHVARDAQELVVMPDVDIVYVASANIDHARHSIMALQAGKHVLCEKPIVMSVDELHQIRATSQKYQRLFMDGTFQAYLPSFQILSRHIRSKYPFMTIQLHKKIKHKLMQSSPLLTSRNLGGGIYEGTGSYTAHMLVVLMGVNTIMSLQSDRVIVSSTKGVGNVDWQTIVSIEFPCGTKAIMSHVAYNETKLSTVRSHCGSVKFDLPKVSQVIVDEQPLELEDTCGSGEHQGLGHEAKHAMDLVLQKRLESPLLPFETSLAITHLMDIVRSKLN